MKLSKRRGRYFLLVWMASSLVSVAVCAAPNQMRSASGAVGGLIMSIEPMPSKKMRQFRLTLSNAGESDLAVDLGFMLANGKKQYPANIVLTLIDAQGKSRRLDLMGPGTINGRVDPMVVPLPAGAAFSLTIDLGQYRDAANEIAAHLKPGRYMLEAQFTGTSVRLEDANLDMKGIGLMPYWTGTIESNQARIEIPSRSPRASAEGGEKAGSSPGLRPSSE